MRKIKFRIHFWHCAKSENIAVSGNSITAQDYFLQRILSMKSIAGRAIEHFFRQKKEKKTVKIDLLGRLHIPTLPSRTLLFFTIPNCIRSNFTSSMSIEKSLKQKSGKKML